LKSRGGRAALLRRRVGRQGGSSALPGLTNQLRLRSSSLPMLIGGEGRGEAALSDLLASKRLFSLCLGASVARISFC